MDDDSGTVGGGVGELWTELTGEEGYSDGVVRVLLFGAVQLQ